MSRGQVGWIEKLILVLARHLQTEHKFRRITLLHRLGRDTCHDKQLAIDVHDGTQFHIRRIHSIVIYQRNILRSLLLSVKDLPILLSRVELDIRVIGGFQFCKLIVSLMRLPIVLIKFLIILLIVIIITSIKIIPVIVLLRQPQLPAIREVLRVQLIVQMLIVFLVIIQAHAHIHRLFPKKSRNALVIVQQSSHLSHRKHVNTLRQVIHLLEYQVVRLPGRILIRLSHTFLIHRLVIRFPAHVPLLELLLRVQARVSQFVVFARLHAVILIIANLKPSVFPEHELTPAIRRTRQQVVKALVILHQIRKHMLLRLLRLLGTLIPQYLHMFSIVAERLGRAFIHLVRLYISPQFIRQDVLAKPLSHVRATGLPQSHQLVGAVYLELHFHTIIHIHRNDLMHIVVFANQIFTI